MINLSLLVPWMVASLKCCDDLGQVKDTVYGWAKLKLLVVRYDIDNWFGTQISGPPCQHIHFLGEGSLLSSSSSDSNVLMRFSRPRVKFVSSTLSAEEDYCRIKSEVKDLTLV